MNVNSCYSFNELILNFFYFQRVEEQEKELNRAVDALSNKSNKRSAKGNKAKKAPVKSKDIVKAFEKKPLNEDKTLPGKDTKPKIEISEPINESEDTGEVLSLADRLKKSKIRIFIKTFTVKDAKYQ